MIASYLVWGILKKQFCAVQCIPDGIFLAVHTVNDYEYVVYRLFTR